MRFTERPEVGGAKECQGYAAAFSVRSRIAIPWNGGTAGGLVGRAQLGCGI